MILPYLYMVFVVTLMFRDSGIISRFLYQFNLVESMDQFPSLIYDSWGTGIIMTYALKGIPFTALFLMNIMNQISNSYDDVGSLLGAKEYRLLKRIYLPLSEDMVVWCGMILFAYDFGSFEVPYLLGSQRINMLSVSLYSSYIRPGIGSIPSTMAIGIVLFIIGGILSFFFGRILSWFIYLDITNPLRKDRDTGPVRDISGFLMNVAGVLIIALGLIVTIYMILLSVNSYFRFPVLFPKALTVDYWKNTIFDNNLFYRGLFSSLFIGLNTAFLSTIIGFIAARGIARYFPDHSTRFMFLMTLPLFIPGMALFLGVHQVMIHSPLANHWSGVVLSHVLICLPYTINIGTAYFKGVSPLLEDVAFILGARARKRYMALILPMIGPGIGLSLIISFLVSNTEYFSVFLIGGGNTVTLSMIMYPYIANADQNMASVIGIVFMVLNLSMFYITNRFLKKSSTYKSLYGGN